MGMKNGIIVVLALLMLGVFSSAQEVVSEVEKRVEALQKQFIAARKAPTAGRAMVYEFTRSKDDAKFIAELHFDRKREQVLMKIFTKGAAGGVFFYSNILANEIAFE